MKKVIDREERSIIQLSRNQNNHIRDNLFIFLVIYLKFKIVDLIIIEFEMFEVKSRWENIKEEKRCQH